MSDKPRSSMDDYRKVGYLNLANELWVGHIKEGDLSSATLSLPNLDKTLLEELAQDVESFSTTQPHYGWAISIVAYTASVTQNRDLFLQSLAAWYLARACNHWTQPKRLNEAIAMARRGFAQLNKTGWLAACDWQENAQAWTQPNFAEATHKLREALAGLEQHGFIEFVPECRLSLAYAQILIGEHEDALENIHLSEREYIARGDRLNQARGWLHQASSLRRRGRFDEAFQKLEGALAVFENEGSLTDRAKAHYQIALGHLLKADDSSETVFHFTKATELFEQTELDLWRGMCINNLGSVYLYTGDLKLADRYYAEAEEIFVRHEIQGLLADNLNDHGELNILRGKPQPGIECFKRALAINEKLGSQLPMAVVMTNLGKAYGQVGRYQDALFYLERAAKRLKPIENHHRLGTCEEYIALIWSQLGQPQIADEYLDKSATHYEAADQKALLASVYNYKASAFFQQGKQAEGIKALEQSLDFANQFGLQPQSALAKRLLGEALIEALIENNSYEEAQDYLEQALAAFDEMGMAMEQAACMISMGIYYASKYETDKASAAFIEALQFSDSAFPEIDWHAWIELGNLAEAKANTQAAISNYHRGIEAFKQIRNNFFQPALAGSYLQKPFRVFDRVIATASKADATLDTLDFIEEAKASTLLRNLTENNAQKNNTGSQELTDIKAEIGLLKNQLRVSSDEISPLRSAVQFRQIRETLSKKIKLYDELKARLERESLLNDTAAYHSHNIFDPKYFRQRASQFLEDNWVALDYYLSDDGLTTVMITPYDCQIDSQSVSKRFLTALKACDKMRQNGEQLLKSDLEVLGKTLLPTLLAGKLSSDKYLLISPHRALHQVPWSALRSDFIDQPLVHACIPSIVPSLQSLILLWERSISNRTPDRSNGLLIGLSAFNGLHQELPTVKDEIATLSTMMDSSGYLLVEEEASWKNLLQIKNPDDHAQEENLSRFSWMHIASHFFTDRYTGQLSGITLSDGDVLLDQLRDLAPLPNLVSLSACNGNDSFLYEGDERVDLQTTCFISGANTIVGSLWPVLDPSAAELMSLFYRSYFSGHSPAHAVAQAQRSFIKKGYEIQNWAGFICAGIA